MVQCLFSSSYNSKCLIDEVRQREFTNTALWGLQSLTGRERRADQSYTTRTSTHTRPGTQRGRQLLIPVSDLGLDDDTKEHGNRTTGQWERHRREQEVRGLQGTDTDLTPSAVHSIIIQRWEEESFSKIHF